MMEPTRKSFFCATIGQPLPTEIDPSFKRGRNNEKSGRSINKKRAKPSDIFPRTTPQQPKEHTSKKRRQPQPAAGGNAGWFWKLLFRSSVKKPAKKAKAALGYDDIYQLRSGSRRKRAVPACRERDDMSLPLGVVGQAKLRGSSRLEMTWSTLFPTARCKCCAPPAGHVYAHRCANITYRKFNPGNLTCYGSIYGSDAVVVYWARLLDDVGHYIRLTRAHGKGILGFAESVKVWGEVKSRVKKQLKEAERANVGLSVDLPTQIGKCSMVKVPAPPKDQADGTGEGRERVIWMRCVDSRCPSHSLSPVDRSTDSPTTAHSFPSARRVFELRTGLSLGKRSHSLPRESSPLRNSVVMGKEEDEEIEVEEGEARGAALTF